MSEPARSIEQALGRRPASLTPLHGGCIAQVFRAEFPGGDTLAVKWDPSPNPALETEAFMLRALAARSKLPVPAVVHAQPDLLVMTYVENDGRMSPDGEAHAADLLADLHEIEVASYGFDRDTLIGPLHQPNPVSDDWPGFFRDQRLLPMAVAAGDAGALSVSALDGCRRLADRLDDLLACPDPPSLVHGDCWAGNILWHQGQPAAFIDPACYHGHNEVELAFIELMGNLGRAFWDRYNARRPIDNAYHHHRRSIYQLYPLLVHARLFGGGYGASVARLLGTLA